MSVQEAKAKDEHQKLAVPISYNGMNDSFSYTQGEAAQAVREHALNHYKVHGPDRNENVLFGPDNQTQINLDQPLSTQVAPGTQLYLRRPTAGGGSRS
jgi:hypothetical protein